MDSVTTWKQQHYQGRFCCLLLHAELSMRQCAMRCANAREYSLDELCCFDCSDGLRRAQEQGIRVKPHPSRKHYGCKHPECDSRHYADGWCSRHYREFVHNPRLRERYWQNKAVANNKNSLQAYENAPRTGERVLRHE